MAEFMWCDFGGGKRGVMGRSWPSCGEVGPTRRSYAKGDIEFDTLPSTARNSYRGRVWQICLERMRVRFPCSRPKIAVTLDSPLVRLSQYGLYQCADPFFLAMNTLITWSFNLPPSFPVPMSVGSSRLPPKPPQAIPFVLGGRPRKRLSGDSPRAQWKA